jgi:hypothetical protein
MFVYAPIDAVQKLEATFLNFLLADFVAVF